jgi:spermidine synthase
VHDDGAGFLARTALRPDVVLVDAFDEIGVAPSLASLEFHLSVSRALRPGGLMIMNLSGYRSRYAIHVNSARTAFAGGTLLVPVEGEGNLLLFGFPSPPDLPPLAQLEAHAARLSSEMPIDFRRYLRRIRASKFFGGTHPLLGGPTAGEAADRVSRSSWPP